MLFYSGFFCTVPPHGIWISFLCMTSRCSHIPVHTQCTTVNIKTLPALPERSWLFFLAFLIKGILSCQAIQLYWYETDLRELTQVPQPSSGLNLTSLTWGMPLLNPLSWAEPEMKENFPFGHILCSKNNRHFLGDIPHFSLSNLPWAVD